MNATMAWNLAHVGGDALLVEHQCLCRSNLALPSAVGRPYARRILHRSDRSSGAIVATQYA